MKIEDAINELAGSTPRFARLKHICTTFFGAPRIRGSHHVYNMPWPLDPKVNIQPGKGGRAKPYQVKQALAALTKLATLNDNEDP